jgi:predicted TIM-barrel fold metal-dependent hydrolase
LKLDQQNSGLNRRQFIAGVAATAAGTGLGAILASGSTGSAAAATIRETSAGRENLAPARLERTNIIDIHRHCLAFPASSGLMRTILEKRVDWRQSGPNVVTTVNGVSSIAYAELMDIDAQVRGQKEAGIAKGLLSNSMALESAARALFFAPLDQLTQQLNDSIAALVDRHRDQLGFMATVNPFHETCLKECERCLNKLGAAGINISTSWDGKYLDSPELNFFWDYVQQTDTAVFLHPPQVPPGHELMNVYKLEEMVGRPFDTSMTVARMIYAGVFDRYPRLKIVLPHMGGALAMIAGRLDFGFRLGYKGLPENQKPVCRKNPSDYFRTNLYVDTMGFNPLGVRHVLDLFGVDRVLFGSDYAAVPISPGEQIDMIRNLKLTRDDEEKIFRKNAARLFKLTG